jgi:glycosyltransferase involved in cell wall biosynthesis
MKPFLSIVTISFNQAQFLRQCVDSVVSQKGSDVEYIVVDPGSTDGSREILQSYGGAIDHLVLEPDKGPADGLNKGFARATGEIGYFINSDDFLLPGAVNRMRRLWTDNPEADLVLCSAWRIDGIGRPLLEMRPTKVTVQNLLSGKATLVQQGMSFRINGLRRVKNFNIDNRTCWDYELLCDLLDLGAKPVQSSERIAAFRVHATSISGGAGGNELANRYKKDLDRIRDKFPNSNNGVLSLPVSLLRFMKYTSEPSILINRVSDRLLPKLMIRRWESDQQPDTKS